MITKKLMASGSSSQRSKSSGVGHRRSRYSSHASSSRGSTTSTTSSLISQNAISAHESVLSLRDSISSSISSSSTIASWDSNLSTIGSNAGSSRGSVSSISSTIGTCDSNLSTTGSFGSHTVALISSRIPISSSPSVVQTSSTVQSRDSNSLRKNSNIHSRESITRKKNSSIHLLNSISKDSSFPYSSIVGSRNTTSTKSSRLRPVGGLTPSSTRSASSTTSTLFVPKKTRTNIFQNESSSRGPSSASSPSWHNGVPIPASSSLNYADPWSYTWPGSESWSEPVSTRDYRSSQLLQENFQYQPTATGPCLMSSANLASYLFNHVPVPTTSYANSSMQWPQTWNASNSSDPISTFSAPNATRTQYPEVATGPSANLASYPPSYPINHVPVPTQSYANSSTQWPQTWNASNSSYPISSTSTATNNATRTTQYPEVQNRTYLSPAGTRDPIIFPPSTNSITDHSKTYQGSTNESTSSVPATHENGRHDTEKIKEIQTAVGMMQVLVGMGNLAVAVSQCCIL